MTDKPASKVSKLETVKFTIDSTLLRELGERLVGRPYIALAELIKNAYDADATSVVIEFGDNHIEVTDDGHGMDYSDFKERWMRIGSPHKASEITSRYLKRTLTGSKGVGRLSAQFLARKLSLKSVSRTDPDNELRAYVDWDEAVEAGDLTEAKATVERLSSASTFAETSATGTSIRLEDLSHDWRAKDISDLAREIWWLQPPFRGGVSGTTFDVRLVSSDDDLATAFDSQMRRYHDLWEARLVGVMESVTEQDAEKRRIALSVEFDDGDRSVIRYDVPVAPDTDGCLIESVEFEIRVFDLRYKQPYGIKVDEAREYFNRYGGVYIYDSGFRVPYYGPDADWLRVEIDHSHRLSRSKLLPQELQVPEGMNNLPTNSRLFGVVNISTAIEREMAKERDPAKKKKNDHLELQVSRDRLIDNRAFTQLSDLVRWSLDYYATKKTQKMLQEVIRSRGIESLEIRALEVDAVLSAHADVIPQAVARDIRNAVARVVETVQHQAEAGRGEISLLTSLATAGMMALALQHELSKQIYILDDVTKRLESRVKGKSSGTTDLGADLSAIRRWIDTARQTQSLFSHLRNEEDRSQRTRLRAQAFLVQLRSNMAPFLRGVELLLDDVDPDLRLPPGTVAEWTALFQNVFTNAVNAMVDSSTKRVSVTSMTEGPTAAIRVLDTGYGVDLKTADDLFEPFRRKTMISPERTELAYGGTGLGLTIVRLIAADLGVGVRFAAPADPFSTCLEISWREQT